MAWGVKRSEWQGQLEAAPESVPVIPARRYQQGLQTCTVPTSDVTYQVLGHPKYL